MTNKFNGVCEFYAAVEKLFPKIKFTTIQRENGNKLYFVNDVRGLVIVYNCTSGFADYYRINKPQDLSLETLITNLLLHYHRIKDESLEGFMREFIHYQKGLKTFFAAGYADIAQIGWDSDLLMYQQLPNALHSYDKQSIDFNKALAVYTKAIEMGDKYTGPKFNNAFEFAMYYVREQNPEPIYWQVYNAVRKSFKRAEIFADEYFAAIREGNIVIVGFGIILTQPKN